MKRVIISLIFLCAFLIHSNSYSQFGIDVETGLVTSVYNDIRDPGDTGTLFSFSEELKSDNALFYRLRLNFKFGERHNLSALYAPLKINAKGKFDKDVKFQDATFLANTDIKGTYKFNSYRLTYRYDLYLGKTVEFGLGLTAKIRDAEITLNDDQHESASDDLGFVPLINFRFFVKISDQFGFLLRGDALAAPQGRAEDILAAFTYMASDKLKVKLGYRILEGGADNDSIYTFSLFNYFAAGIIYQF
jgi:hypothetical protein